MIKHFIKFCYIYSYYRAKFIFCYSNYFVQFKFSSRLNRSEMSSTRDNSNLYLNPSGGAIPKQKTVKPNNNRRVHNNCK